MLQEAELQKANSGIIPTPPIPADVPQVELTENARQVFTRRYIRKEADGNPLVTDLFNVFRLNPFFFK